MKDKIKQIIERLPEKDNSMNGMTLQNCSIELYPDTESYNFGEVMNNINFYCSQNDCQYAIMLHDQDYYSEDTYSNRELIGRKGQKKSDHYHYLIHFPHRVVLTTIADKFGIEPRWIKRLKKDQDFDNMLIYCTHIRYDDKIKHHYEPDNYNTNIMDYIRYLYDLELKKIDDVQKNIVNDTITILKSEDHKYSVERLVLDLENLDYGINDILKYYRILKDLIVEHNQEIERMNIIENAKAKAYQTAYMEKNQMFDLADAFGSTEIERDEKNYYLVRTEKGKKKGK